MYICHVSKFVPFGLSSSKRWRNLKTLKGSHLQFVLLYLQIRHCLLIEIKHFFGGTSISVQRRSKPLWHQHHNIAAWSKFCASTGKSKAASGSSDVTTSVALLKTVSPKCSGCFTSCSPLNPLNILGFSHDLCYTHVTTVDQIIFHEQSRTCLRMTELIYRGNLLYSRDIPTQHPFCVIVSVVWNKHGNRVTHISPFILIFMVKWTVADTQSLDEGN